MLIDELVGGMPEQRRMIYTLSRNEGLSNAEIAERLVAPDDIQQQMFVPNVRHERRSLQHLQRIIRIGIGLQIRYRMGVHPQRIRRNAPVIPRKHLTAYVHVSGDISMASCSFMTFFSSSILISRIFSLMFFLTVWFVIMADPAKVTATPSITTEVPAGNPRPEFIEKFSHCCNTES